MLDGLVLMYVKEGVMYPVSITQEQWDILQKFGRFIEPYRIINKPYGKAIELIEEWKKQ